MPLLGLFLAEMLAVLTPPLEVVGGVGVVEDETRKYCTGILIIAFTTGLGMFLSKYSFGTLGQNVTKEVRKLVYASILGKNIGFFDAKENGTSVLTSAMEEDASVINGVGGESVGPFADALCACALGVSIAFYYCWQ